MEWKTPKINWNRNDFYNFEDLNRVENNTNVIAELLVYYDAILALETVDTERTVQTIEMAPSLSRIERNIQLLGKRYQPYKWVSPKQDWVSNTPFSFEDANRLERNLYLLYHHYKGNLDVCVKCGAYTCGEEAI